MYRRVVLFLVLVTSLFAQSHRVLSPESAPGTLVPLDAPVPLCDLRLFTLLPDTVVSGDCITLSAPPYALYCGVDTMYPNPSDVVWRIVDDLARLGDSIGTSQTYCAYGFAGWRRVAVISTLQDYVFADTLLVVVLDRVRVLPSTQTSHGTHAVTPGSVLYDLQGRRLKVNLPRGVVLSAIGHPISVSVCMKTTP